MGESSMSHASSKVRKLSRFVFDVFEVDTACIYVIESMRLEG